MISWAAASQKYSTLEEFQIKTYAPTRWERMERILSVTDLDNRKPSALANKLLTWLSEFNSDILLQQVFLCALPVHVQDALTSSDLNDLERLADWADEIMARPCRQAPHLLSLSSFP